MLRLFAHKDKPARADTSLLNQAEAAGEAALVGLGVPVVPSPCGTRGEASKAQAILRNWYSGEAG